MPALLLNPRVPLRERCNIDLRVDTSVDRTKRCHSKKMAKPSVQTHRAKQESQPAAVGRQQPSGSRDQCAGEVIPGIILAFHGTQDKAVKISGESQFTHVISISPSNTPGRAVEYSSLHHDDTHIRALHLTVPHYRPSTNASYAPRLSLSAFQVRAARDFLSLALPYTAESSPTAWSTISTRLLITTPFNRPVDAVCIVAAYLSFTSGEEVCDVLSGIDDVEELPNVWKRKVCEEDAEIVSDDNRG